MSSPDAALLPWCTEYDGVPSCEMPIYGYTGRQGARRGLGLETEERESCLFTVYMVLYIYLTTPFVPSFTPLYDFHSEKDSPQDVGSVTGCRAHEASCPGPRWTGGIAFHLRRSPGFSSLDQHVLLLVLQLTRSPPRPSSSPSTASPSTL